MFPLPADALALLSLVALLLLPGLVIVRSPWTFVPFLSLGFWLVTWLLPMGQGRSSLLVGWLASTALLVLLRLPRLPARLRPRWPSLVVFLAAVAELAPLLVWAVPPGTDAAFSSIECRLLWGADRIPTSDGPLGAVGFILPSAFGVPALAADVALLSGVAPERAVLLVSLAARGLLTVALFGLARRLLGDATGAIVALSAAGLSRLSALPASGGESIPLAGALAVSAFALLLRGEGRAPAVAAGLFLVGGVIADPLTAILPAGVILALVVLEPPPRRERCLLTLVIFGLGLIATLARWYGPLQSASGAGGLVPVSALDVGRWCATLGLLASAGIVALLARMNAHQMPRAVLAGILLAAGVTAGAEVWARQTRVLVDAPTADDWKAQAAGMPPLSSICGDLALARAWIPSLTGRPLVPAWKPAWLMVPARSAIPASPTRSVQSHERNLLGPCIPLSEASR